MSITNKQHKTPTNKLYHKYIDNKKTKQNDASTK